MELTQESSRRYPAQALWYAVALFSLFCLGAAFYDGLALMVDWWSREEYSHGYLIPGVAIFLIW